MPNTTPSESCGCGMDLCEHECDACAVHRMTCDQYIPPVLSLEELLEVPHIPPIDSTNALRVAGVEAVPATTYECAHCGNDRSVSDLPVRLREASNADGERICISCASSRYQYSERMGRYVRGYSCVSLQDTDELVSERYVANPDNDIYYSDLLGSYYADRENAASDERARQAEIDREESRGVYSYHDTTAIAVHSWNPTTSKTSLCFGVELEMEHKSDDYDDGQEELAEALGGKNGKHGIDGAQGKYILMRDGSLNDSGVELITIPYTLEQHQNQFGWKGILSNVTSIGRSGRGTTACGMHVHVNRAALSAFTLGKMLVFVNSPSNTALIEKIAQRNPEEWARRYKKKIRDGLNGESDKYEAMHLSHNTVEFRIFRGNLRYDRVLKNIEFCHAVTMYARDTSMQDLEKPTLFVAWLAKRKGTYPNLSKFLSETAFNSRLSAAANAGSNARPSTTVRASEEI